MKILFLCTAHNSLSQRLYLVLSQNHNITVEYALSDTATIEAAQLSQPDIIICPFLTSRIPAEVYERYLTLIVHPGPPGDAGPSSLDWLLMGDDGTEPDAAKLLQSSVLSKSGRSHWGVTVLQAEAEFDAGPVWAFEQFPIDIDEPGLTKSDLYRGAITRAAVTAVTAAIERIRTTALSAAPVTPPSTPPQTPSHEAHVSFHSIHPRLVPNKFFGLMSVTSQTGFLGGQTHHRPLLKASQRDFDAQLHGAGQISRRLRCSDSQPGCLNSVFGTSLYLYGGIVEESGNLGAESTANGSVIAVRGQAVCLGTCDGKGIWITHIRRPKRKNDALLWPKVPAVSGLKELGVLPQMQLERLEYPEASTVWSRYPFSTHQEVWADFVDIDHDSRVAYVYFDFYNGAMSTDQCSELIQCLEYVIAEHDSGRQVNAVIMMGGDGYFSNGIHLNVIEASADAATESWNNINRINDVVHTLLHDLPRRKILTVAGIRGNAAAGGVALATACDIVISGAYVILNPAYRALGLYGSEYHTISYNARCGVDGARKILHDMAPLSAYQARSIGLIDHVLPGHGAVLDKHIRNHVKAVVRSTSGVDTPGSWKDSADLSPSGLAKARSLELGEMAKDFWSPRSERYHFRRQAFVRKTKPTATPLRFAAHRRNEGLLDEEETQEFDDVAYWAKKAEKEKEIDVAKRMIEHLQAFVSRQQGDLAPKGNPGAHLGDVKPFAGAKMDRTSIFSCYYDAKA